MEEDRGEKGVGMWVSDRLCQPCLLRPPSGETDQCRNKSENCAVHRLHLPTDHVRVLN